MKGDSNFRELTSSDVMCFNEVHIYKNVIPTYMDFVKNLVTTFNPDNWIPKIYYADSKKFPELGDQEESLLVLEDLQPFGFRLGPRLDLDEAHLRLMIKNIAEFHSVYHTMKIKRHPKLQSLIDGMKPFTYLDKNGKACASYQQLFRVGLLRVFNLVKNSKRYDFDPEFVRFIGVLEAKHGDDPTIIMQSLLRYDDTFTVLLHGDYNRNNVLFQYDKETGNENPLGLRMIDFQVNPIICI
jgi:hypothetical protein